MKSLGSALVIVGFILSIVAFFGVSTTVEVDIYGASGGVANFHGMHVQAIVLQAGLAAFLGGIILIGFGEVAEKLGRLDRLIVSQGAQVAEKTGLDSMREHEGELSAAGSVASEELSEAELSACERFQIVPEGGLFRLGRYRYATLEHAIAAAKSGR